MFSPHQLEFAAAENSVTRVDPALDKITTLKIDIAKLAIYGYSILKPRHELMRLTGNG